MDKPVCGVCRQNASKYKCPSCRLAYCSLGCYKTHKESPCGPSSTGSQLPQAPTTAPPSTSVQQEDDDEDDEEALRYLLTETQLKQLEQSSFFHQTIQSNDHFKHLFLKIENSPNRMKELEKALLDPNFAQFLYKLLDQLRHEPSSSSSCSMK